MSNTMSLKGGLNMYAGFGERYESDIPPEGRKVFYMQKNGFDHHQEHANKYFKKNDVLTIKEIYVGRSSSEVEFVEHPNQKFNTVMFADFEIGGYVDSSDGILAMLHLHHDFVLPKNDARRISNAHINRIAETLKNLDTQEKID